MKKTDLSIATITLVRNDVEEKLLRESLQHLSKLELPVYITDGGSNTGFLQFLRSVPNFNLLPARAYGVYEQAKNSLSAAYQDGYPFVFYTEPDKKDFFQYGLPRMLEEVNAGETSGIVTASRSPYGLSTFPAFQQMTEATINNCCKEVLQQDIDYTYGPFILSRRLIPYLNLLKDDVGWGWRPYVFNIARRLGFEIEAFTGDLLCPEDQRIDTPAERVYRMKQLTQNIQGLVLSTNISLGHQI